MRKSLLLLFCLLPFLTKAQKKNFTLQEAVLGLNSSLAVKNLDQLKWMGATEKYAQAIVKDNWKGFVSTSPKDKKIDTLISLTQLSAIVAKAKIAELKSLPSVEWFNENNFYFQHDHAIVYVTKNETTEFALSGLVQLPNDADNIFLDPTKQKVAFTSNHNLFVQDAMVPRPMTNDGSENLVYGSSVHREEFGIDHGIFWSPKSNAIAYYRMDQSMVEDYPVVNWAETPATVKNVKYPFAGRTSHQVSLLVYNLRNDQTVIIQTGEPKEQYLTNISWSPDEKSIFIQVLNRAQNHMKLNQYDANTGAFIKTLVEEKNDKYVEPQHELYFTSNNEFIYWSQRDGYTHLYLYNTNGDLIKQLTKGNWLVNEIVDFNKKTKELIYVSSENSVLEKNVYVLNIKTGESERLNPINATHTVSLSGDQNYLIDNYSSTDIPRKIDIVEIATGKATNILNADNPLLNYNTAKVEWKELKADDGTLLYGKLIYPTDFDAKKKYPVIVYLYNGPHIQLNKNTFPISGNLWYDYMAQKGYFVFILDGRGSDNRGFKFESAIHRQMASIEMQDQLVGVNYIKSLPYVDGSRMGIHGWSYGGFMTTSFMLRQPDVFKVGVAGGSVLDWSMYEIMYTERYMGTPQNNEQGYKNNLLVDKIKNLKGKLLLIHGTDDATVVWQHSFKILKQAVKDNIQVDYFAYPGYAHNVRGKDRVHLMQKISDYFDLYLK